MAFVFNRDENESWLQAALRIARRFELEKEVEESYAAHRKTGSDESEAAMAALYDWDVLPYEDD